LYLAANGGELVPLAAVAKVELGAGPEQINHRERRRAVTIQVKPSLATPLEIARQTIENEIIQPIRESGALEGGRYRIETAGTADKLTMAWSALGFNLILAVAITYLLMAGLFESFLYPFVIMVSVPLAAVGGFAGLFLANLATTQLSGRVTSLDILTMLGFVILIGTVVNNAILIVHQALNLIRDEGQSPRDAVLESTRTRIRPIFMSTSTTVLGMMPLVIMPGAGSEIYRGLGSVVLGGLIVSTIFSLILVPTLFTLMLDLKRSILGLFGRKAAEIAAAEAAAADSHEAHPEEKPQEEAVAQAEDHNGDGRREPSAPNVGSKTEG
jgi:HAE1 family hydrophobic/amphiphilic exporter-1